MYLHGEHHSWLELLTARCRQAEKWAQDENPELRDLITASADNVAATNDIQRYYNQVFHRLSSTLALCIKEEEQLGSKLQHCPVSSANPDSLAMKS